MINVIDDQQVVKMAVITWEIINWVHSFMKIILRIIIKERSTVELKLAWFAGDWSLKMWTADKMSKKWSATE